MAAKPIKPQQYGLSNVNAWHSKLSASHRGPKPGRQTVQKAPKLPNQKVRF